MLKEPSGTSWEFEGFKVLTEMRVLLSGAAPLPLTSKAFDTLVLLIENRDRVVTKDELLRSVWPDVEVEEGNLTQQIRSSASHGRPTANGCPSAAGSTGATSW